MIWIIVGGIGFVFGLITPLAHIVGLLLFYHLKTRVVNQKMILMNFSIISIFGSIMYSVRGIYTFIYKDNTLMIAKYFLHTNGLFIGCGLCYTLLLFLLTVDRLLITMRPFKYSKIFSKRSCIIALTLIGSISAVISISLLVYLNRDLHIKLYIIGLAVTGILSLFNLISYIFIYRKIKNQLKRISSKTRLESKRRRSRRKALVPLMINIQLILCFLVPHTLLLVFRKKLGYFKLTGIGMTATNIGLFVDALIYILNTSTRKVLYQKLDTLGFSFMTTNKEESLGLTEAKYNVKKD